MHTVVTEVAPDIWQIRHRLPFALNHVQCYLLRDGDGWTLLDTGLHNDETRTGWEAALAQVGASPRSIRRIILSHAHPDHYGGAGWLQHWTEAPVLASAPEQRFARTTWMEGAANEHAIVEQFLAHGMPADMCAQVADDIAALRLMTQPAPVMDTLVPDQSLQIGERTFAVVPSPGHSDGHCALYSASDRLLLCADTLLIKITPNIALWPRGNPDPLRDFLHTIDRLNTLDVALALPGHGPLITNYYGRLSELRHHHDDRLTRVQTLIADGATAFAVCASLFAAVMHSSHQARFAMAETLSHLEYLVSSGRAERLEGTPVRYRASREA